jgi:hypothetical protein
MRTKPRRLWLCFIAALVCAQADPETQVKAFLPGLSAQPPGTAADRELDHPSRAPSKAPSPASPCISEWAKAANAVFIAIQGWYVTGFDPTGEAVRLAQANAARV